MYENVITNIKNSSINCKKLTKEHKNHVPYLNAIMLIYIQTNTHSYKQIQYAFTHLHV